MNNLVIRALAGFVFSVLVICSAWLGPLALGLLFLIFSTIGLYEFYSLNREKQHLKSFKWTGLAFGVIIYLLLCFLFNGFMDAKYLWLIAVLGVTMLCLQLVKLEASMIANVAVTWFGWIYVILPFALINLLANITGEFSYELPVGFFLILWANDSGAYLIGKYVGRTKLYEKVSPNKTWEGLFGGIVFAFATAYILSQYFISIPWNQWIMISLIISIFGNLGDLFESQLKRTMGVKDSGNIIPGHGGVLDRFDGLLFSLPIVLFYLSFC